MEYWYKCCCFSFGKQNKELIRKALENDERVILLASQYKYPRTESDSGYKDLNQGEGELERITSDDRAWVEEIFQITDHYDAVVYIDEADFGSHTDNSTRITEIAVDNSKKMRHVLHGTGTNIQRAMQHGREISALI